MGSANTKGLWKKIKALFLESAVKRWGASAATAVAALIAFGLYFFWEPIRAFGGQEVSTPVWILGLLILLVGLFVTQHVMSWNRKRKQEEEIRSFQCFGLDWELRGAFLSGWRELRIEMEGDTGEFIRGPLCPKQGCLREIFDMTAFATREQINRPGMRLKCACGEVHKFHPSEDWDSRGDTLRFIRTLACREAQAKLRNRHSNKRLRF